MPPTKFKPNEKKYNRHTGKVTTARYYMKAMPKKELIDYLNGSNSTSKKKHKVLKELERRGIKLTWRNKDA
jgi:hypothetical protein